MHVKYIVRHIQKRPKVVSHLDGEVISHVFPNSEAAQEGHPAASTRRRVIVKEPPHSVQHTDQPKASEQQVKEQKDAGGRCEDKAAINASCTTTAHYISYHPLLI